jgi:hypothetical protein
MARVKALTDRTIAERFAEIKTEEQVWGEISAETSKERRGFSAHR